MSKIIKTCNKCCNAQAEEGSKYCKKCNAKKSAPKAIGVNKLLNKIGFRIS